MLKITKAHLNIGVSFPGKGAVTHALAEHGFEMELLRNGYLSIRGCGVARLVGPSAVAYLEVEQDAPRNIEAEMRRGTVGSMYGGCMGDPDNDHEFPSLTGAERGLWADNGKVSVVATGTVLDDDQVGPNHQGVVVGEEAAGGVPVGGAVGVGGPEPTTSRLGKRPRKA